MTVVVKRKFIYSMLLLAVLIMQRKKEKQLTAETKSNLNSVPLRLPPLYNSHAHNLHKVSPSSFSLTLNIVILSHPSLLHMGTRKMQRESGQLHLLVRVCSMCARLAIACYFTSHSVLFCKRTNFHTPRSFSEPTDRPTDNLLLRNVIELISPCF